MAATGLGEGQYVIGSVPVTVSGVEARNGGGRLAGSTATMDQVVRTMIEATGCSLEEAVTMASSTPAAVIGHEPHLGDLVLLDNDLAVAATAIGGTIAYRRAQT
jgi:N-acetylglucosamine-6-phosphate deacetylase